MTKTEERYEKTRIAARERMRKQKLRVTLAAQIAGPLAARYTNEDLGGRDIVPSYAQEIATSALAVADALLAHR